MTDQQAPRDIHALIDSGEVPKPALELGQDDKVQWGRDGNALTVTEMGYGDDGAHGPYFQIAARSGDQPVTFRLYLNGSRDQFLQSVASAVAAGPIGGLRLRTYDTGGGKPRVELEPA